MSWPFVPMEILAIFSWQKYKFAGVQVFCSLTCAYVLRIMYLGWWDQRTKANNPTGVAYMSICSRHTSWRFFSTSASAPERRHPCIIYTYNAWTERLLAQLVFSRFKRNDFLRRWYLEGDKKVLMEKALRKETFEIILGELGNLWAFALIFSLPASWSQCAGKREEKRRSSLWAESFEKVLILSNYWLRLGFNQCHSCLLFRFTKRSLRGYSAPHKNICL